MKTQIQKNLLASIGTLILCSFNIVTAQFTGITPAPFDDYETTNNVSAVGVGNFSAGVFPQSAFHINTNFTAFSSLFTRGEVFRTTGPSTNVNAWRMFTGAGNGTERFSITIPANSNDAVLQTQQPNSRLLFNTNGALNRMLLMDGGTTNADGRIAMGNNLLAGFVPQARLHLHQTAAVNAIRFTTDNMAGGIGFEVGYNATSNIANQQFAEVNNRENTAMKFFTNNTQRFHINQSRQSQINGYTVGTPGYVGIGENVSNLWGNTISLGIGPFSLLHLNNERGNTSAEQVAYRPWMRGGITFTDNTDLAYVGYRSFTDDNTATGNIVSNRNEFAMVWTNNPFGSTGPDDMCFRFVGSNGNVGPPVPGALPNTIDAINLTSISDLDGLHIARFTAAGNMGLGPTFGEDHPIYVRPQSLLHMSRNDTLDTWLQITNQTGTLQTATDGLRIGITGTGTAHIRQQEILPLIFYTGSNTGAIEDARIIPTSASTLPLSNHGMVGLGNWTTATNLAAPIDAKLDIDGDLRIRTVTPDNTLTQILAIDPTDHNRVHWIDGSNLGNVTADNGLSINPANNVQLGNDVGLTTAQLLNDREIPMNNNNIMFNDNVGSTSSIGIGHPLGTTSTTAGKLEVTTDVKLIAGVFNTNVTSNSNIIGVFANSINNGNGSAAGVRGLAQSTSGPGNATGVRGVSLGTSGSGFAVGVGGESFSSSITNVGVDGLARNATTLSIAGNFDVTNSSSPRNIGVQVYINNGTNPTAINFGEQVLVNTSGSRNYGLYTNVTTASVNYGVWASAPVAGTNRAGFFAGDLEYTGLLMGSDKMFKINVANIEKATDVLRKLKPHTYNMDVTHFPQFNFQDRLQYGFIAQEVADVLPNLVHESYMPSELDSLGNEIHPAVSYKSLNYNGLIPITVQAVIELNARVDNSTLSDQNVKTNVQNLANSLDKVKQMRGVSYEWSSSAQNDMNLDSLQHIGFIAQEITAIEPLLTFTGDSSLVHVNYDRVAPLLVESVKELDTKNHTQDSIIQALDSINNDLETRLTYLENCIRNANICTEGNRTMNTEPDDNINNRSVELVNTNSIILDQNLPNPFAENTVINYNIPTEVVEAKLLFYDLNGRIIKELIIEERGESRLTVYGTNLKTGVYTYSLIADGELIATKKMVKK